MNEEQAGGIGKKSSSWLRSPCSGVLLLPGSPRRRGQAGKALDGNIGDTWQDGGQVVTDRDLHPAAALHDGQNRRHLRARFLAAYVDPVLPAQRHRTHGVLRQVVAQLQLRVLQEARELFPLRERVVCRLPQRTRRQASIAGCLDFPADYLHQWPGPLQTQDVACGVTEFLLACQGVDSEQLIDPFYDARGNRVVGVELDRIEELPP